MNELKIHDIKNLEVIPDISIFIFGLVVLAIVAIIVAFSYLLYKFFKNKTNPRKEYYRILKDVDFKDSKKSAYIITKYARKLSTTQRDKKLCDELIYLLQDYKYKKNVTSLDNEVMRKYELFMESIDV